MPDFFYGAATNRQSWSASGDIYSPSIPSPTGRVAANGLRIIHVRALSAWVTSRFSARSGRLVYGSATTVNFSPAVSSTNAVDTGFVGINTGMHSTGGNYAFRLQFNGGVFYAWGGAGTTNDGGGIVRAGSLAVGIRYAQAPAAPTIGPLISTDDGKTAVVTVNPSGDTGDDPITGYRLQWATDPGFTTGGGTIDYSQRTFNIHNLTPGQGYYWRAASKNSAISPWNTTGPWSPTYFLRQADPLSFGQMRNPTNGAWVNMDGRIRNAADTAWVELDGRIRNAANTAWEELGSA